MQHRLRFAIVKTPAGAIFPTLECALGTNLCISRRRFSKSQRRAREIPKAVYEVGCEESQKVQTGARDF
jgi:hypothetical protein